ncbi:SNF1-interacting protein [Chytriomyces hyalinus]|nr:SNF1-interacting protein [Chytriomyces hyalinus]
MKSPSLDPAKTHTRSHHVSLQMAARDSPFLRANLNHFEDELEELLKWVDGLIKAGKGYAESFLKMNDYSLTLVSSFISHRRLSILGDTSVLDSFAEALKTVCSLNAQMADDFSDNLVLPLQRYLREEIKELREHRKNHDRVTANYDAALLRYSQLPKNKETSALHEDSFVLFEAKKAYIHSNLNYADHVIAFKNKMIYFFVQQLMLAMYTHMDYFENNFEVFLGMKTSMDALKVRIEERRRALPTQEEILSYKNALEEEALSLARPKMADLSQNGSKSRSDSPSLAPYSKPVNGAVPSSAATSSMLSQLPASAIPVYPTEIEGYLFKKNEKKVWVRRYFLIKKGSLFYANTYPNSKTQRGAVLSTDAWTVANYSVRVDKTEDRRCVFEVYGAKRSIKLQAESDKEMMDWINVFEAARSAASKSVSVLDNFSALSSGGQSGLKGNQLITTAASSRAPSTRDATPEEDDEDYDAVTKSNFETEADEDAALEEAGEVDDDAVEVTVEDEGGEDNLAENPIPFTDCPIVYQDKGMEARNKELHKLLKSVPPTDYLIDSFGIFLQRANLLQGKIYVTQNRICFYSNLMGIISVLVIHLKDVTSITRTKSGLHKCINIETTKAPHQFKTFLKDDEKTHFVISEAWKNATKTSGRLTAQDLFDNLTASEAKLDEKDKTQQDGEDGSSLAAAESLECGDGPASTEFDLPEDTPPPSTNPSCECPPADHHEVKDQEFSLNIPAKRAFELIFSNDRPETNQLWSKLFASRNETNVVSEAWVEPSTGTVLGDAPAGAIASKSLNYIMPMNNPMVKLKEVGVESIFYLIKRVEYFVYVVEKRGCTPAAPYGDNFTTITRYCITWTGKNSCKISMYSGVKFFKSPMVKGIIKQQAMGGSAGFSADFAKMIKSEVNSALARENSSKSGGAGGNAVEQEALAASDSGHAHDDSGVLSQVSESVLPFGFSHSFFGQWGLVGLLGLSIFLNLYNAFKSGPVTGGNLISVSAVESRCILAQHDSLDWRKEIAGTIKVGTFSEKSILGYLKSHYPAWNVQNCNMSSVSPWLASMHHIAHFPPPPYHNESSKLAFQKLHAIQEAANQARQEALQSLKWLDEVDRDIFWAGYWNWVADSVVANENENKCKEIGSGASKFIGGCARIRDPPFMDQLPGELLQEIAAWLDPHEIQVIGQLNRRCRHRCSIHALVAQPSFATRNLRVFAASKGATALKWLPMLKMKHLGVYYVAALFCMYGFRRGTLTFLAIGNEDGHRWFPGLTRSNLSRSDVMPDTFSPKLQGLVCQALPLSLQKVPPKENACGFHDYELVLFWAAFCGYEALIQKCVASIVSNSFQFPTSQLVQTSVTAAFLFACSNNQRDSAHLLLESEKVDLRRWGKHAFAEAACVGSVGIVELLISWRGELWLDVSRGEQRVSDTAFLWASQNGHFDVVECILRSGVRVSEKILLQVKLLGSFKLNALLNKYCPLL